LPNRGRSAIEPTRFSAEAPNIPSYYRESRLRLRLKKNKTEKSKRGGAEKPMLWVDTDAIYIKTIVSARCSTKVRFVRFCGLGARMHRAMWSLATNIPNAR
jgi:hypothetical protein